MATAPPPASICIFLYQLLLDGINRKGCYYIKGFIHFSVLQMTISLPGMTVLPCHDFFPTKLPIEPRLAKLSKLIINRIKTRLQANQNSGPVLHLLCPRTSSVVGKKYPGQEPAAAWCSQAASLRYGSRDLMLLDPRVTGSAPCCWWLTQEHRTKTSNSSFFSRRGLKKSIDLNEIFRGQKNSTT